MTVPSAGMTVPSAGGAVPSAGGGVPSAGGAVPSARRAGRPARVLVVGDVVTDVVVRTASEPVRGSDTPAAIRLTGGGGAANTACWLAAAGSPVTLVARVGDDAAGRERRAELAAAGVDAAVAVDPSAPTGTIVVLVAADGERTMLPDRGANLHLSPADVDAGFAAAQAAEPPATHLHLSGYAVLHPGSRPAGLRALAAARGAGFTVSVDAASAAPLAAAGPAAFLTWIAGADLLFANADEAAVLTGGRITGVRHSSGRAATGVQAGAVGPATGGRAGAVGPATAKRVTAERAAAELLGTAATVVVKLGAGGALWWSAGLRCAVDAEPVEIVDSTGAGDAFAAGLLTAWLGGADPDTSLRAGVALGARAVGVVGARPEPDR